MRGGRGARWDGRVRTNAMNQAHRWGWGGAYHYTLHAIVKTPKNQRCVDENITPPLERKVTSPDACARVQPTITQLLKASKKIFYLCIMSVWELEIQSRFRIGPAVGFSIYLADTEYDYSEFILFLLFISIHFKWEEPWTD